MGPPAPPFGFFLRLVFVGSEREEDVAFLGWFEIGALESQHSFCKRWGCETGPEDGFLVSFEDDAMLFVVGFGVVAIGIAHCGR